MSGVEVIFVVLGILTSAPSLKKIVEWAPKLVHMVKKKKDRIARTKLGGKEEKLVGGEKEKLEEGKGEKLEEGKEEKLEIGKKEKLKEEETHLLVKACFRDLVGKIFNVIGMINKNLKDCEKSEWGGELLYQMGKDSLCALLLIEKCLEPESEADREKIKSKREEKIKESLESVQSNLMKDLALMKLRLGTGKELKRLMAETQIYEDKIQKLEKEVKKLKLFSESEIVAKLSDRVDVDEDVEKKFKALQIEISEYKETYKWDSEGYNEEGFNEAGFDSDGFDEDGIDFEGFDISGFHPDGYDRDGFDGDGKEYFDSDDFNIHGYDKDGYDVYGLDEEGFDENGYDEYGFDEDGYDEKEYDEDGFNKKGLNKDGISREVVERALDEKMEEDKIMASVEKLVEMREKWVAKDVGGKMEPIPITIRISKMKRDPTGKFEEFTIEKRRLCSAKKRNGKKCMYRGKTRKGDRVLCGVHEGVLHSGKKVNYWE